MDQEKFVSTDEVREYTNIFANVFGEIQKKLKKNNGLTFSYRLVGSAKFSTRISLSVSVKFLL